MGYFENNIYIQTAHSCVRNSDILNVNTSSDMCVFEAPLYYMTGASNVVCSAATATTSHIYFVSTATTKDLTFNFTANTSSFESDNTKFKFEMYKYDDDFNSFHTPATYISNEYGWSGMSATSAVTVSVPLSRLDIDGDYLIKGYFTHDVCTEFANRLGYTNDTSLGKSGTEYGLFNPPNDYFLSIIRSADEPIFGNGNNITTPVTNLRQISVIPTEGQTYFILNSDAQLDFIVTLNGLTLSEGDDYDVSQATGGTQPYAITLYEAAKETDIITFIYTSRVLGSNGLTMESIDVNTAVASGVTGGQGSNSIYYNTDTNKYEAYISLEPSDFDTVLVTLNGVTLAINIDYYQSTSDPKRIIFEGLIFEGDIINITYNQNAQYIGNIDTATPEIAWNINNLPQNTNGKFILEFASDEDMLTQVTSGETPYIVNETNYSLTLTITGTVGTKLYYRVTNCKNYDTFCGQSVQSISYSDIIPITITSNSINSY